MLHVFLGFDKRQPVAYHVARASIERHASVPVAITPLRIEVMPCKRTGLTEFTWSRFCVPHLMGFQGRALFLDSDFLFLGDVAEVFAAATGDKAVWVSKNEKRFEWASLIVFDCAHPANAVLTPEYIETARALHGMQWLADDLVGELPGRMNHLCGYDKPITDAVAAHYTQGLPIYEETKGSPYAAEWQAEHKRMNYSVSWMDLMGRSVHAAPHKDGTRLVARLHPDAQQVDSRP